jgi:hypothetical protein
MKQLEIIILFASFLQAVRLHIKQMDFLAVILKHNWTRLCLKFQLKGLMKN